ncbi:MAG: type IV pilus assembly protein PilM [bacterium]|nr:type IV pilus assembly protein PilM [bacterium]
MQKCIISDTMKIPFGSFTFIPKTFLGVDIGTSSIKAVELYRWGERRSLKNYGELEIPSMYKKPFRTFEKNALLLERTDIAKALKAVLEEAHIEAKQAVFSIPDFSSFFTNFELPPMSKKELGDAVAFEARRHIPVPLSEVVFDWQLIEGRYEQNTPLSILMVAVPNEVVRQYQEIAKEAGLQLVALEAEVFGLIRSCIWEDERPIVLLDIGAQSTAVNAVFKGSLRISHSFDIAGNALTERIAKSLSIDYESAQREKAQKGMTGEYASILSPLVDMILGEVEKIADAFQQSKGRTIEKIILGGGSAKLPGLKEYVQQNMRKEVEIADPFRSIYYPPILEGTMKATGPSYAVSVGMALRGLE